MWAEDIPVFEKKKWQSEINYFVRIIFLIFVDTFHFRFRSFFFVLIKIISMKKYSDIERIKA